MVNNIVYLWIENLNDLYENLGVNLGSEFIFNISLSSDKLVLDVTDNENYIPNFFQLEPNNGITNVSAFVGKNGTGKSLLCEFIRDVVGGDYPGSDFIIIYKSINSEGVTKFSISNYTDLVLEVNKIDGFDYDLFGKNKGFKFRDSPPIGGGWNGIESSDVIYYSPIVDFSNITFLSKTPVGIDVSSNYLYINDIEHAQGAREKGLKASDFLTITRAANFRRRYLMVHELGSFKFPTGGIELHLDKTFLRLVALKINLSDIWKSENGWNVPIGFKTIITKIENQYSEERRKLNSERSNLGHKKNEDEAILKIDREIYVLDFVFSTLKYFVQNLNNANTHVSPKINLIPEELFERASTVEMIKIFFTNQKIINYQKILPLIESIENIKDKIQFHRLSKYDEPVIQLDQDLILNLFINSLVSQEELIDNSVGGFRKKPEEFLEFDWGVKISSGENAYLDLFSRLYHAKKLIEEKTRDNGVGSLSWPELIVIILDEGELGFHPQWQKEYLCFLLKIIPNMFMKTGKRNGQGLVKVNHTNIQLIVTSHSPFSLSDIPIRHVNFFDKKSDDNGKFQPKHFYAEEVGLKGTFGANIHELYAESFFLNNGFMGEFAVKKINDVINAIQNESVLSEEEQIYVKKVINLIGEPLIKQRLSEMFNEKYISKRELEDEIRRLTDIYNSMGNEEN